MTSLMSGLPSDIYMKKYHGEDTKTKSTVVNGDDMDIHGSHLPAFNVQSVFDYLGEFSDFLRNEKIRKNLVESDKLKVKEKILDIQNSIRETTAQLDHHLRPYLSILQVVTGLELIYYINHVKTLRSVIRNLSGLSA